MFDILNCVQSRALREYWHVMNYTPSFKECIYFIYHSDDISLNEKIEMSFANIKKVKEYTIEAMANNRKQLFMSLFTEENYENFSN